MNMVDNQTHHFASLQDATDLRQAVRAKGLVKRRHLPRSASPPPNRRQQNSPKLHSPKQQQQQLRSLPPPSHYHLKSPSVWGKSLSPSRHLLPEDEIPAMPRMVSAESAGSVWSSALSSHSGASRRRSSRSGLLTCTDDEAIEEMDQRMKARKPARHRHTKKLLLDDDSRDLDLAFERARDIGRSIEEDSVDKYAVRLEQRIRHASRTSSPVQLGGGDGRGARSGSGSESSAGEDDQGEAEQQHSKWVVGGTNTTEGTAKGHNDEAEQDLLNAARAIFQKNQETAAATALEPKEKDKKKEKKKKHRHEKTREHTKSHKHKKKSSRKEKGHSQKEKGEIVL